jgi:hypothetical protein
MKQSVDYLGHQHQQKRAIDTRSHQGKLLPQTRDKHNKLKQTKIQQIDNSSKPKVPNKQYHPKGLKYTLFQRVFWNKIQLKELH